MDGSSNKKDEEEGNLNYNLILYEFL